MKKAALVLVGLYGILLLLLSVPVAAVCFAEGSSSPNWKETLQVYGSVLSCWVSWVVLAIMLLCEWALLSLPVRAAAGRPVARRSIWSLVIAAGFLIACMAFGMACALIEFLQSDVFFKNAWQGWTVLGACLLLWLGWALLFARVARTTAPQDVLARQCRALIQGSILSFLVAVPTHIVARHRGYCCAGFSTFLGIAFGLSVMLLAFGPGVFALYAARWRARHPAATPVAGGDTTATNREG